MQRFCAWIGLVACAGAAAWVGCGGDQATTDQPVGGPGATSGAGGGGPGLGVGATCKATSECRLGLTCDSATSKCAPGHTLAAGAMCTISGECKQELDCL